MKKTLLVFLAFFIIIGGLYIYGQKESGVRADLILVFGAPLTNSQPSKTLRLRCERAADYLNNNSRARALLLGGINSREEISEAQAMANYLVSMGIDESRLILEENSTSTWTNLKNAKSIMESSLGLQPVMVCSSDYHMLRIKCLAGRLALQTHPLPVVTPWRLFITSYFREVAALIKSFLIDR